MKLYKIDSNFSVIQTGLMYILIIYLFKKAPDSAELRDILLSQEAWERFTNILLPSGAWFFH
jgi:hypothetical protein